MSESPDQKLAMLQAATEHHRAGRLAEARRGYTALLASHPSETLALFRLGILEQQEGHAHAALRVIDRAYALSPDDARIVFVLGQVLDSLHRWQEASELYRRALLLEPGWSDAEFALGCGLQRTGRLTEAVHVYRGLLAHDPDATGALGNLGAALRELGDLPGSIRLLRQAAAREPHVAAHAVNLGLAFCETGDFAAAEAQFGIALRLDPDSADAHFNRGNALRGLGRSRDAVEAFRLAIARRADHVDALINLGNTLKELGDNPAAMQAFESALALRPHNLAAINNAGCLLRSLKQLDAAEQMFRRGLQIDAAHPALHDNLGNVLKDAGDLDAAIACYRRALEIEPDNVTVHSNLAYSLSFQSSEPGPILAECTRWAARFAEPLMAGSPDPQRDLSEHRRLRVGYVSGDFREHCQSLFMLPLLTHHDQRAFDVVCYSSVDRPDGYTRRLTGRASLWREVRTLSDASLAQLIAADHVDVLVDLNMHMANGRPRVFARKPAPVQIAWLAYPGTTGMAAMDYRLSDPWLEPAGYEAHYRERTLRLDDTFWCYDPLVDAEPVASLPAARNGHLTLGCLNNPCKLTDRTLELWGAVLRAVPASRFVVLAPEGRSRDRLLGRFAVQGVDARRIEFVGFQPRVQYLRTYHDIDLCLDTLPYNGHTTSLDALWMGVPVITRVGDTCVGRGGLSMLHNLGLAALAADCDAGFERLAVELAGDLPQLARLRAELRGRMSRSPLMDGERFARSIERAYRLAWRTYARRAQALNQPQHKAG